MHHLPDQQAAIAALAGTLADGGRLALDEGGLRLACLPWDLGVGELTDVVTRSFLLDLPSPVSAAVVRHIVGSLQHRVDRAMDDLDPDDLAAWRRLLDPHGDAYLGRRGDLYCLRVDTVHCGVRRP